MKTTIATLATVASLMATVFNPATAKGTNTALSAKDWTAIAEQAEIENATALEEIPVVLYELTDSDWERIEKQLEEEGQFELAEGTEVTSTSLDLNLKPGMSTNMVLQAPFANTELVGVVVIDNTGKVISSAAGKFETLKNVQIPENRNATYVVRAYSASQVFETKVQVLYL